MPNQNKMVKGQAFGEYYADGYFSEPFTLCADYITEDGSKKSAELREGERKSRGPGKGSQLHFASEKYPIRRSEGCSYTSRNHIGSVGVFFVLFFKQTSSFS